MDPDPLVRLLTALGKDVRVAHCHFTAPSFRGLWTRLMPTVYSEVITATPTATVIKQNLIVLFADRCPRIV